MTLVIVTNYACISYDIVIDSSTEEVATSLSQATCLFSLKNGGHVLVNAQNAISVELKDTPLEEN